MIFKVQDAPSSLDRMKEALQVLAESRNSSRLREFLKSGNDRAWITLVA
jgi:hypothetical protein